MDTPGFPIRTALCARRKIRAVADGYAHREPEKSRLQHPYLVHLPTSRRFPLGHFHSPPEYTGEWRCDLHPRYSPDGRKVVIDSAHEGQGRQMYLIDISKIVEGRPEG